MILALLLIGTMGQQAVAAVSWDALEFATPATLAVLMPVARGGDRTEKRTTRIPGVAQWQGLNVEIATTPRGTGRAGLCTADVASTFFRATPGADRLIPGKGALEQRYLLAEAAPTLGIHTSGDACGRVGGVLANPRTADIIATAQGRPATFDQVVFALGTVLIARRRLPRVRCKGERDLCRGPDMVLGTLDMRRIYRLELGPCPAQRLSWCVDATLERAAKDGFIRVSIVTGDRVDAALHRQPTVKAASIATELWPIA